MVAPSFYKERERRYNYYDDARTYKGRGLDRADRRRRYVRAPKYRDPADIRYNEDKEDKEDKEDNETASKTRTEIEKKLVEAEDHSTMMLLILTLLGVTGVVVWSQLSADKKSVSCEKDANCENGESCVDQTCQKRNETQKPGLPACDPKECLKQGLVCNLSDSLCTHKTCSASTDCTQLGSKSLCINGYCREETFQEIAQEWLRAALPWIGIIGLLLLVITFIWKTGVLYRSAYAIFSALYRVIRVLYYLCLVFGIICLLIALGLFFGLSEVLSFPFWDAIYFCRIFGVAGLVLLFFALLFNWISVLFVPHSDREIKEAVDLVKQSEEEIEKLADGRFQNRAKADLEKLLGAHNEGKINSFFKHFNRKNMSDAQTREESKQKLAYSIFDSLTTGGFRRRIPAALRNEFERIKGVREATKEKLRNFVGQADERIEATNESTYEEADKPVKNAVSMKGVRRVLGAIPFVIGIFLVFSPQLKKWTGWSGFEPLENTQTNGTVQTLGLFLVTISAVTIFVNRVRALLDVISASLMFGLVLYFAGMAEGNSSFGWYLLVTAGVVFLWELANLGRWFLGGRRNIDRDEAVQEVPRQEAEVAGKI